MKLTITERRPRLSYQPFAVLTDGERYLTAEFEFPCGTRAKAGFLFDRVEDAEAVAAEALGGGSAP